MLLNRVKTITVLIISFLLLTSTSREEILYMQTEHWPPYVIFDKDEEVSGLDIDILKEVSRRLNVKLKVVEIPWARALVDMEKGSADILSNVLRREEREKYMHYLEPPYVEYTVKCFYIKKGSGVKIEKYSDIYRYKIGITRGSAYFPQFDEDSRVNKVSVATTDQQIKMLMAGYIDALIGTESVIDYLLSASDSYPPTAFEKSTYQFRQRNPLYFTISHKSPFMKRVPEIEQIIKELFNEGFIDRAKEKYH